MTLQDKKDLIGKQLTAAKTAQEAVRSTWESREQISLARLSNSDQHKRKSRISEGSLSTIVLERSGRTVAQLPSGKIKPASKMDEGNSYVMNLCLQRYVFPNANDQFALVDKLFLVDYFSDLYGGVDVLSYWRIDDDYVGPDFQILNPRNVFWQAGKTNKSHSEYVFVSTFVSKSWLEKKKELSNWKSDAINRVLKQIKDGAAKPSAKDDAQRQTTNAQEKNSSGDWGTTQEIEVVTKYERGKSGKWITFLPDYDNEIIRSIKNPNDNGTIPVKRKEPLLPLLDSIYGQGSIERGESMQKAIDSVVNLTHDGLKYTIFPITKYNGSIVSRSSMRWEAGAFWNMSDLNAVSTHQVGNQALGTFQPTYQFLKGAMLNQNGTTDTAVSESDGLPGMGKTPAAIKKIAQRESTFDRICRDRFEAFWSELVEDWVHMIASKQEKPIEFYIYDEEIDRINAMGYKVELNEGAETRKKADGTDVTERGSAKLTLKPKALKGNYRYIVDAGTSMQQDDAEEHEKLGEVLLTALKVGPEVVNQILAQEGKTLSFANLFKRWVITGGAKDWDEIIQDLPEQELLAQQNQVDPQMEQQMMQEQMMQQQAMEQQAMEQQAMQQQQMQPPMPQMEQPMSEYQPDPETLALVQQIQQAGNDFGGMSGR